MPKLEILVIHCTATPEGRVVLPDDIRKWHTDPILLASGTLKYKGKTYSRVSDLPADVQPNNRRGRGWSQVGYSDMIMLDGTIVNLVKYNDDDIVDPWEVTNGATGINSKSRHVVYVGGADKKMNAKDTRTDKQLETMKSYIKTLISKHPSIKIAGHNQFAQKACPSFDVPQYLESIGIPNKNIFRNG